MKILCTDLERKHQHAAQYYIDNKDKINQRNNEYYQKNKNTIKGRTSKYYFSHKNQSAYRQKRKESRKKYEQANKCKLQEYQQKYKKSLVTDVFSHYSNGAPKCAYCGIKDVRVLTLDHINGGGRAERKKSKTRTTLAIMRKLQKENYPEGYQILCANCQLIKYKENQEWRVS